MKITGNELATPLLDSENNRIVDGLTIRQQFAMAAMQGLSSALWDDCTAKNCAKKAIEYADELIKALNETPNPNA